MSDALRHAQLMDQTYRYQRLIYDLTRKCYLLGRDHLIEDMNVQPGARVLEIASGTGRNLAMIHERYPEAKIFGFDISDQMLTTARAKLDKSVSLAHGDACRFDPWRCSASNISTILSCPAASRRSPTGLWL